MINIKTIVVSSRACCIRIFKKNSVVYLRLCKEGLVVKHMNMMVVLLLCAMHSAQGMEVLGETKPLINESKQSHYSSMPKPKDDELKELKVLLSFSAKLLPAELKKHIASNFVKIYLEQEKISIESDPILVLRLLCRAQNMCPLKHRLIFVQKLYIAYRNIVVDL